MKSNAGRRMVWASLATAVLLMLAGPLCAGPITDLFKKAPKPKPEERVPQLLIVVKTDQDEHKRAQAADELRDYDPVAFSDIIPTLFDVLHNDNSASVRVEAVQSLGKFRPISKEVGWELELAEKDPSMRVKIQARTSILQYHLAGYHSPKKGESPVLQSGEPPAAGEHNPPNSSGMSNKVSPRAPIISDLPPKAVPVLGTPTRSSGPSIPDAPQKMPPGPASQPASPAPDASHGPTLSLDPPS